jgi:hypothetical protein
MKKIITTIVFIFTLNNVFSQNKRDTTITWYSVPCYDSLGNLTIYKKTYNHIPTRYDTIEFGHIIDSGSGKTNKINSHKPKK